MKPNDKADEERGTTSSVLHYGGDGFDHLWSQGTDVVELWRQDSPCGQYEMIYRVCHTAVIPWPEVGMCEIVRRSDGSTIARLMRDHYTEPQYVWLSRDRGPVLVWASTYLYGYEVVDFGEHTLRHVEENPGEDFIWTGVCLSPDQRRLAIEGCYWACPYAIRILDVSEQAIRLPFREIGMFQLRPGILQWTDELRLQTVEDGRITWRGIIKSDGHEAGRNLAVWQALIRNEAEVDQFLTPKELKERIPSNLFREKEYILIEVLATTAEESLMLFRRQLRPG